VGPGPDDQVLGAGRALSAASLEGRVGVDGALQEDVVPAARVETGDVDLVGPRHDVDLGPPVVPQAVLDDLVEVGLHSHPLEPVEGQRLAHAAALVEGVVVDVGRGHDRHGARELVRRARKQQVLGDAQRRASPGADVAVAPGLLGDPVDGGATVTPVLAVDALGLAARGVQPAHVLGDAGVAEQGEGQADRRQTGLVVRGPHQDRGPRPAPEREVHVGGEQRPVGCRHVHVEQLRPGGHGRQGEGDGEEQLRATKALPHGRPLLSIVPDRRRVRSAAGDGERAAGERGRGREPGRGPLPLTPVADRCR